MALLLFRSLEAPRIPWLTFYCTCTCAYATAIVVVVLTLISAFTFMPKRSRVYAESCPDRPRRRTAKLPVVLRWRQRGA